MHAGQATESGSLPGVVASGVGLEIARRDMELGRDVDRCVAEEVAFEEIDSGMAERGTPQSPHIFAAAGLSPGGFL